jgi:hypothetical protein
MAMYGNKEGRALIVISLLIMLANRRAWLMEYFDEESIDTALRSRKYVSKHHPQQFQKVVLTRLESSINQLHKQFNLKLHD